MADGSSGNSVMAELVEFSVYCRLLIKAVQLSKVYINIVIQSNPLCVFCVLYLGMYYILKTNVYYSHFQLNSVPFRYCRFQLKTTVCLIGMFNAYFADTHAIEVDIVIM